MTHAPRPTQVRERQRRLLRSINAALAVAVPATLGIAWSSPTIRPHTVGECAALLTFVALPLAVIIMPIQIILEPGSAYHISARFRLTFAALCTAGALICALVGPFQLRVSGLLVLLAVWLLLALRGVVALAAEARGRPTGHSPGK